MKKIILLIPVILFFCGCGTFKPPWPTDRLRPIEPFQFIKSCDLDKDSKLMLFVSSPSTNPENDIFTKELIINAEIYHNNYERVKIWLYYPSTGNSGARILPESPPSLIIVETSQGTKTIRLGKNKNSNSFYGIWKEFLTPNRLTFIENCIYGF